MTTQIEIEAAFRDAATRRGLLLPAQLAADGTLHRCPATEKPRQMDCAYILHLDSVPAGGFENHRDGAGWENWCAKAESQMSDLERTEHRRRLQVAKVARETELTARRDEAKTEAAAIWAKGKPAEGFAYLVRKGVKTHGLRVSGARLLIPVLDPQGTLCSLQSVAEDGSKRFLPGGRKQGCFYPLGDLARAEVILVAEGYATAASLHEATGVPAVVAFDCGNLKPAAEGIRRKYPRARIVICADDDAETAGNPGVTHAEEAANAVGGYVAVPKFGTDRKPGQTDWNDVHQVFGIAAVKQGLARFMRPTFSSLPTRLVDEAKERVEESHHVLPFGIKFLDDVFGGIMRTDLVLIGAKTGVGKTGCATRIAQANCYVGKRVHYFALEAEDKEIERRMKYQIIAEKYYAQPGGHRPICYADWRMGKVEDDVEQFNDQADEELSRLCRTLHTYYKDESFTSEDFENHFEAIQGDTDLAILDLFSEVDSDDENENRAAKRIINKIRSAVLRAKKPVVIVGHVRKSDPRFSALVPGEEDFHGSSALIKAVTKGVMLAPDYDTETNDPMLWSTFIKAVKYRMESARTRYCARLLFDVRNDSYRREYALGRLVSGGKKWQELNPDQIPAWSANPRPLPMDTIPMEDE